MITLYALFCVLFAWINRNIIKRHGKVRHGVNAVIHLIWFGLIWHFKGMWPAIGSLFLAKVIFDTSLNLFRGLGVEYLSPEVKRYRGLNDALKGGRVLDWIEYKIFKDDGISPKLLYLFICFVLLNIR